jgi:hypothetical protein
MLNGLSSLAYLQQIENETAQYNKRRNKFRTAITAIRLQGEYSTKRTAFGCHKTMI